MTRFGDWKSPRVLAFHEIILIKEGYVRVRKGSNYFDLHAGDVFYFQPGVEYEIEKNSVHPYVVYFLSFKSSQEKVFSSLIRGGDSFFLETLLHRLIKKVWDSYLEGEEGTPDKPWPKPFFTVERESVRRDSIPPIPISIFYPEV